MEHFITFIIGACLASFIITMTQRHLLQIGPLTTRSLCDHCKHPLAWWQLVPLVGFTIQGGRCHWCRQRIDPWSSRCELICGTWLTLYSPSDLIEWLACLVVLSSLLTMATTDWYACWINPLTLIGLIPLPMIVLVPFSFTNLWAYLLVACLLLLVALFSHGIGQGDVEWLVLVLVLCGWRCYWQTVLIGCGLAFTSPKLWRHQRLPFLPYLSLGLLVSIII